MSKYKVDNQIWNENGGDYNAGTVFLNYRCQVYIDLTLGAAFSWISGIMVEMLCGTIAVNGGSFYKSHLSCYTVCQWAIFVTTLDMINYI